MSHTLEFLLSMLLVLGLFAALVSHVMEVVNARSRHRGRFLWLAVQRLFGGCLSGKTLQDQVRNHPLVRAMSRDDAADMPSYLPSTTFADVLIDVVMTNGADPRIASYGIGDAIAHLPDDLPLKASLRLLWTRTGANPAEFRLAVATLFDEAMARATGWYKRDTQRRSFWLGLALAVVLNVDAVHIAIGLWGSPSTTAAIAGSPQTQMGTLDPAKLAWPTSIPAGWPAEWARDLPDDRGNGWMYHLMLTGLGMLLIAAAGALGAPVWFDLLGRLLPLRAAGPPPQALAQRPAGPAGPAAAHSAFETHLTDAARSSRPPLAEEELSSGDGAGWRRLREALGLQVEGGADEALRDAIRRAQQKLGFSPTGQPTHLLLERLGISVGPVG